MKYKDIANNILKFSTNGTELKKNERQLVDWAISGEISHIGQLALQKLEKKYSQTLTLDCLLSLN